MNTESFRHVYNYHFAENRKIWTTLIMSLTQEQFTQDIPYSLGSIRNHVVHMMSVDEAWFNGLQGIDVPPPLNPVEYDDRQKIRAHWDTVEQMMRDYLAKLQDEQLFTKPFTDDEDKDLIVWQVLLHVITHGTDHRAQLLRLLHDLGVQTESQDYIFYIYEN